MILTDKRLRLCNCFIAVTLIFIWGNSLLPGEISRVFSDWTKELLSALLPGNGTGAGQGSGLLRKIAHFTEFTVLGTLLAWRFGMLQKQKQAAFLWGAAVASMDEFIQVFVPGRTPKLTDVLIDSCGVLTGLLLLYAGHNIVKRKQTDYLEDM